MTRNAARDDADAVLETALRLRAALAMLARQTSDPATAAFAAAEFAGSEPAVRRALDRTAPPKVR